VAQEAWVELYESHALWGQLDDSRYALEQAGVQEHGPAELNRQQLIAAFRTAAEARAAIGPFVVLTDLDSVQNQVASYFNAATPTQNLVNQQLVNQVLQYLRTLPPPLPKAAARLVTESVATLRRIRTTEVAALEQQLATAAEELTTAQSKLQAVATAASEQKTAITQESAKLDQAVAAATARFDTEIARVSAEWDRARAEKEREAETEVNKEIALLAEVAALGRRLVAHASGRFTAASWQQRATRDRKAANYLFSLGILVFVAAGALAYVFIWDVTHDQGREGDLSVGESLLRISLVVTLGAAIAYIFAESGRRRREANSAEEVATVLNAVEAFTATASTEAQAALAAELGRMVFVDNIRSRLGARDAVRGHDASNPGMQQLMDLAGELAKSIPSK